jgi:serine protease Do
MDAMQRVSVRTVRLALFFALLEATSTELKAQYSRRTPIVEAVQKTRNAIVTIKVQKSGDSGSREVVGTGVIVDERGYVVTNRHVLAGGDSLAAFLADGTSLESEFLVDDPSHDLAILRVQRRDAGRLPALPLGPSSDLMVGETVIAVGHPFGYKNTVSTGIVSALGRQITMPTGVVLTGLIQTNASINPGNSGGPLLNINGELIGINVALRDGAQGIAFALDSGTVQEVLSQYLSARRVAGVSSGFRCRELVLPEGPSRQRAVVEEVAAEGPAEAAGLKPGDVIRQVADRSVANRFDVERALWGHRPGEKVALRVERGQKEMQLSVRLVSGNEAPLATPLPAHPDAMPDTAHRAVRDDEVTNR